MAFVGFWMIPLAIVVGIIEKVLSVFGFDLMEWLSRPETLDGFERILEIAVNFVGRISSYF
ncbi:MAG: hypothetical protein E7516_00785 [Ruminococcaceae bacterium]|nr:hypothetical protein [Oscillospiraceae bacterium]